MTTPVSYTHLDVYKRQLQYKIASIMHCNKENGNKIINVQNTKTFEASNLQTMYVKHVTQMLELLF